jgi:3-oxoacyl-[acyl-carrier protein] reductase
MGELSGRVALVTGTAHGIGTAIANGLEEDGAKVHRVDRDTADLTDSAQVAKLVARIGRVDVLVNNAGGVVGQVGKPLDEVSDQDWRAIVDANLTSAFLCTRAVIPAMKAARAGWIVNISSGAGRSVSLTGIQAYASA